MTLAERKAEALGRLRNAREQIVAWQRIELQVSGELKVIGELEAEQAVATANGAGKPNRAARRRAAKQSTGGDPSAAAVPR